MKPHPKIIDRIIETLRDARTVCVVGHVRPDGDCVGSQLGLTMALRAEGKKVWCWNQDDIPHGIASDNNAFAKSTAMDTDDSYSFTFTTPGTYAYFCYIHPHMTGTIVVEAAAGDAAR